MRRQVQVLTSLGSFPNRLRLLRGLLLVLSDVSGNDERCGVVGPLLCGSEDKLESVSMLNLVMGFFEQGL